MAKDKTKPRPELAAKREAMRVQEAALRSQHRRRLVLGWVIGIVIVAMIATGITAVILHVQAGQRALQIDGKASVAQITPPNATSDGLAIWANPAATLASDAITVDIHVDFQDPTSIMAMQYYGTALASLANEGKIKLLYHIHIASDDTYANTAAGRAAEAATCADTVNQFSAYAQAVFNAAPLSPSSGDVGFSDNDLQNVFSGTANITGDDLTAFKKCYTDRATSTFVEAMAAGNLTTAVPNNATYTSGVSTVPLFLANDIAVDINTDMNSAQAATDDETSLLTLLQNTVAYGG